MWQVIVPAVGAALAGLATRSGQSRLPPRFATAVLTTVAALSALAITSAVVAVAVGFVLQVPQLAAGLGWCREFIGAHDRVPAAVGLAALLALPLMALQAWRAAWRHRPQRHEGDVDSGVEILPFSEAVAYARPGRPGYVVVSVGMLGRLDADERRVLFAHEQAHLDCGHHRYVATAAVAASAVPLLRPLLTQVRFATERWADEVAAEAVGDRRLVARAIVQAAVGSDDDPQPRLALARFGTQQRVAALLTAPPTLGMRSVLLFGWTLATVLTSLWSSTFQIQHVIQLARQICGL